MQSRAAAHLAGNIVARKTNVLQFWWAQVEGKENSIFLVIHKYLTHRKLQHFSQCDEITKLE